MKFLFTFLFFSLVISALALTDKQKEKLKVHNKECIEETHIDTDKVKKFRQGDWSTDDEDSHKYWFCMFKKSDIITDDGHFKKDVAMSTINPEDPNIGKIRSAMDDCEGETGADKEETAYKIMKCYHSKNPGHDMF